MEDLIDTLDFQTLLAAIFRQAVDDYIKLQHPKYRKKKYLVEAFQNAVDMFFDPDFRMSKIQNEEGDDMSIQDMITIITDDHRPKIKEVHKFLIQESVTFWQEREIKTVHIPDDIVVHGYVYNIHHQEEPKYNIDYQNRILTLNKLPTGVNEECFVNAVMEIVCYHYDIVISKSKRDMLSDAWFKTLKVNSCFSGAD